MTQKLNYGFAPLQEAVKAGWFHYGEAMEDCRGHITNPRVNMEAVMATAGQIASGMAFLHSRGVIHGDLSATNVMLASAPSAPHGFCAKVCYFSYCNIEVTFHPALL